MADPTTSSTRTSVALPESVETSLKSILKDYPGGHSLRPPRLSEQQVDRISELLAQAGRESWSKIPRTYAVLHMMNKVEDIEALVQERISDFWFPFTVRSLPDGFRSPTDQYAFLELQDFVLTKALDLRIEDGQHRHFAKSNELPFVKQEELGKDDIDHADRVLSTISHQQYARKLIPRGKTFKRNAAVRRDFETELENLKKLRHEHIVQLVGSYADPKSVAILMAPVAEMDLKVFLAHDPLTRTQLSLLRTFYGCLAVALQYLHEHRITHKNIEPQNILVKGHQVLLTGFGLSLDWSSSGRSTTTGHNSGEAELYHAPEVGKELPQNTSADLWSLGCVFLEMWTVLKGESVANLTNHLVSFGNGSICYCENPDAVVAWCDTLETRGIMTDENQPLSWIQYLLCSDQDRRWTAETLVTTLMDANEAQENSLLFIGNCCSHLDDDSTTSSLSSRQPSRILENTGASRIEACEPNTRAREHIVHPQDLSSHPSIPTAESLPQSPLNQELDGSSTHDSTSSSMGSSPKNRRSAGAVSKHSWTTSRLTAISTSSSPLISPIRSDIESFAEQFATLNPISTSKSSQCDLPIALRPDEGRVSEPSSSHGLDPASLSNIPAQGQRSRTETHHIGVLEGHRNGVLSVAFSGDGAVIASGSGDHTVRIWNAFTGTQVRKLEGHTDWVRSVAFSPDDATITSGSDDGAVKTWDVVTGRLVRQLEGQKNWVRRVVSREHKEWVMSVALSPDSKYVASGSGDHTVNIFNVYTGRQLRKLKGHTARVWSVVFSPDGTLVASGSEDQTIRIWDVATGKQTWKLEGHTHWVNSVTFSPNGAIIASGSEDQTIRTWDAATGKQTQKLEGHTGPVTSVVFSPDGTVIASASSDGTVRTWNTFTGRPIREFKGHKGRVWSVAFSPDGTVIASGSEDRTIKTWDIGRVVSEMYG